MRPATLLFFSEPRRGDWDTVRSAPPHRFNRPYGARRPNGGVGMPVFPGLAPRGYRQASLRDARQRRTSNIQRPTSNVERTATATSNEVLLAASTGRDRIDAVDVSGWFRKGGRMVCLADRRVLTSAHDAAGNMTLAARPGDEADAGDGLVLVYDAWNRLVEAYDDDDADGEADAGELIVTTAYDGLGRRIAKTVEGDPDVTYDYYWTGYQVVEVRKDEDTDPYEQVVWGRRYVHSPVCRWFDADTDGQNVVQHYYANDANFNVTALVETDGTVAERYTYDPYGTRTIHDDDWSDEVSWANSEKNEILFTGHRLDPETGLYYCLARHYHPALGRWVQRDPIGYADGMALYEYVVGNPTGFLDPAGRQAGANLHTRQYTAPTLRVSLELGAREDPDGQAANFLNHMDELITTGDQMQGVPGKTTLEGPKDGNAQSITDALNENQRCAVIIYIGHNEVTNPAYNNRTAGEVFGNEETGLKPRHQPAIVTNRSAVQGDVRGKTLHATKTRPQNIPDTTAFGCYTCNPNQYNNQIRDAGYSILTESEAGWSGVRISDSGRKMNKLLEGAVRRCRRMRRDPRCECKCKIVVILGDWM